MAVHKKISLSSISISKGIKTSGAYLLGIYHIIVTIKVVYNNFLVILHVNVGLVHIK